MIVYGIGSQPKSSRINMNSYDEESADMRSTDLEDTYSDNEDDEASTTPRSKKPSKYEQKEHPKSQILGDQRCGVQTKRKIVGNTSYTCLALLL